MNPKGTYSIVELGMFLQYQTRAAKGCLLQDDLTCAPKPEPKKEK